MRAALSALGAALVVALLVAPAAEAGITFDRAWGRNVDTSNPSTGPEVCTVAANCAYGSPPSNVGGAVFPQSVGTDTAGNVYVTEFAGNRVQKFDSNGQFLMAFGKNVDGANPGTALEVCTVSANCTTGTSGTAGGEFTNPKGIAIAPGGNIWVSDTNNNRVQEFSPAGAFLRALGQDVSISTAGTGYEICTVASDCKTGIVTSSPTATGGQIASPDGIAVDAAGKVYVANQGGRRVEVFNADGTFDRAWGSGVLSGTGNFEVCTVASQCRAGTTVTGVAGEMTPAGLGIGPNGHVYVFDAVQYRVEEFTAAGGFVRLWGKDVDSTTANTGFEVCDIAANCKKGEKGTAGGEFLNESAGPNAPAGNAVAVGADGTVYVTDRPSSRVQAFTASGAFLAAFGFDVDPTVGTGSEFEVCTVAANCVAGSQGGGLGGGMATPTGIAAGPGGAIYQGDQTGQRIQRFFNQDCAATFALSDDEYAASEDAGPVVATIERSGATGCPASVHYATSDESATAGSDYTTTSGTATFAPGETTSEVSIPLLDDGEQEPTETLALTLSDPGSGAILDTPSAATVTITDDEPPDTTITTAAIATNAGVASYSFTATPSTGATFECSYDNEPFASCTSPDTSGILDPGTHNFRVRATNANGTDPTPAIRNFIVDRVAPTVAINLSGAGVGPGAYAGSVNVDATATDPALSSGIAAKYCAVDPPTPPTSLGAFNSVPCGFPVSAPGLHTAYAIAKDNANNESTIVSTTFRIQPYPNTSITSGPNGVSYGVPKFTFSADIAGSTFECKIDDAPFARCSSPLTPTGQDLGDHILSVRAISPEGLTDPTPATRGFTLGQRKVTKSCSFLVPYDAKPKAKSCKLLKDTCPSGSICTADLSVDAVEADPAYSQTANVQMLVTGTKNPDIGTTCQSEPGGGIPKCPRTGTASLIGADQSITLVCENLAASVAELNPPQGPDDKRRISCSATYTVRPAGSLTTTATGGTLTIFAPGAGVLGIATGGGLSGKVSTAESHARAKPPFKPASQTTSEAGPVDFKLKLSKSSKKKLKKKGKLKLPVTSTFNPTDGSDSVTKTSTVTLTGKRKKH